MRIADLTFEPAVILAPMSGISDQPFRRTVRKYGADLVISEMIASDAVLRAVRSEIRKMSTNCSGEFPMAVQLAGSDPKLMAEAAKINEDRGAAIIDINFGCPARKVTNKVCGSALMRNEKLASDIMTAVVEAVSIPVTMKMRTGWDDTSRNAPQLARIAEEAGIQMITVHGRTRCQFFKGHADWSFIRQVKDVAQIPIIANGDIRSPQDAAECLKLSGADGVMIGRAIYQNPYFLKDIENVIFKNSNILSREEIVKQILKYLEEEIKLGTKVNQVMRHTVGLYFGQPGSKEWKKYLSDNMMARDSDFQKSKHIMTIVQNNEKANQANT